jgi:hypothetical protein
LTRPGPLNVVRSLRISGAAVSGGDRRREPFAVAQGELGLYPVHGDPVDDLLRTGTGTGQLPGQLRPSGEQNVEIPFGLSGVDSVDRHREHDQHDRENGDDAYGDAAPYRVGAQPDVPVPSCHGVPDKR